MASGESFGVELVGTSTKTFPMFGERRLWFALVAFQGHVLGESGISRSCDNFVTSFLLSLVLVWKGSFGL